MAIALFRIPSPKARWLRTHVPRPNPLSVAPCSHPVETDLTPRTKKFKGRCPYPWPILRSMFLPDLRSALPAFRTVVCTIISIIFTMYKQCDTCYERWHSVHYAESSVVTQIVVSVEACVCTFRILFFCVFLVSPFSVFLLFSWISHLTSSHICLSTYFLYYLLYFIWVAIHFFYNFFLVAVYSFSLLYYYN